MSVAEAFVTLRPDTTGFGAETEQQVTGELEGSGASPAMAMWMRRAGIAAGAAGATAVAGAYVGGFQRALDREEAIVTFRRLGLDEAAITTLTDEIDEALRGTVVTNPEGFALAGRFLAAGFDEADIPGVVSSIADLAQVGNRGFADMADVIVRAAGQGRITAVELARMGDVPIGRVAEQLGMTEEAFRSAVSAGEISAEAFLEAFSAVDEFRDAAKDETTRQSISNLKTAIAAMGEAIVGPVVQSGLLRDVIGELREAMSAAAPFFRTLGQVLLPAVRGAAWLVTAAAQGLATQFEVWRVIVGGVIEINRRLWEGFLRLSRPVVDFVRGTLMPAFQNLWDRFQEGAYGIGLAWSVLWRAVRIIWDRFGQPVFDAVGRAVEWVDERLSDVVQWFRNLPGRIVGALGRNLQNLLPQAGRDIIQGLWNGMTQRWQRARDWVSGLGSIIQRLKGPLSVDRRLLIEQGRAVIQGFQTGMEDQWVGVSRFLEDRTRELSGVSASGGGRQSGLHIHGDVNVGNRSDLDELPFAVHKLALEMA